MMLNGYSQISGSAATYKDTSAPATAPDGSRWYYEYKIAAFDCRLGQVSTPVDYPATCSFNATFGSNGAGGGTGTLANPFVMQSGDSLRMTAGTGVTSVQYTVYLSGAIIAQSSVLTSSPYTYSWPDLSFGSRYQVTATASSASCTEYYVLYVTDDTPSPCAFPNGSETTLANSGGHGSNPNLTAETYTISNSGQGTMTLAGSHIKIDWHFLSSTYNDMTMTGIDWGCFNDAFSAGTTPQVDRVIPSCVSALANGQSRTFKINWSYAHNDPTLTTTAGLDKICIGYTIPVEGARFCNLVGQSGSTHNPTGCD
jgi:hypothetical protein